MVRPNGSALQHVGLVQRRRCPYLGSSRENHMHKIPRDARYMALSTAILEVCDLTVHNEWIQAVAWPGKTSTRLPIISDFQEMSTECFG